MKTEINRQSSVIHTKSLCLIKHEAKKICGEVEVQLHVFLKSAPGRGELSASSTRRFIPEERTPLICMIKRMGGPQTLLQHCSEKKIVCLCWESNPNSSVFRPVS
jgi:hypothetical protein